MLIRLLWIVLIFLLLPTAPPFPQNPKKIPVGRKRWVMLQRGAKKGESMLNADKTRERELLLTRLRELDQEIAESQCELWELKKRQAVRLLVPLMDRWSNSLLAREAGQ
jgi:hypothetical protein